LAQQFRITGAVLTDGFYWRIQPLLSIQQLAFIGCITLWIGPWLRDVGGIADKAERADIQLFTAAGVTVGFALSGPRVSAFRLGGPCVSALRRVGLNDFGSVRLFSLLFALVCGWLAFLPAFQAVAAWALFGFLGACCIQYMPFMVQAFPTHYAGRVTTSSNLVV